jgi:hypothetical protein
VSGPQPRIIVSGANTLRAYDAPSGKELWKREGMHEQLHERLLELAPTDSLELQAVWQAAADAALEAKPPRGYDSFPEPWLVLITCRDEQHQVELLQRFQNEGLPCKALLS